MSTSDQTQTSASHTDPPEQEPAASTQEPRLVVAIGASAGGLEALEQLFTAMPVDTGLTFIIAMHRSPDRTSLLPELLGHHTTMTVVTAVAEAPLQPDTVYILPATEELIIAERRFRRGRAGESGGHSIDRFFSALAREPDGHILAVILSGAGSDGAQGAAAIKRLGGTVIVQEPGEARYPDMPQSVIAAGVADLVLPVTEMPARFSEIAVGYRYNNSPRTAGGGPEEPLTAILDVVHGVTGHDFHCYKTATIQRRVERRMRIKTANTMAEYLDILRDDPKEAEALYQDILIGVTGFFRDPEAFETLRLTVIPRLFEHRPPDDPVRIWHPGCATGEEAYSMAILIREYLRDQGVEHKAQIFATDLDEAAVAHARTGIYADSIATAVGAERLAAWFTLNNGHYQVTKQLREMIVFARHSLLKDPRFSRLDLLVCRNFLIYLDQPTQQRLMLLFHQAIKPGGVLFLGSSETVGRHGDLFAPLDQRWKLYTRQEVGYRPDLLLPNFGTVPTLAEPGRFLPRVRSEEPKPVAAVEKQLLERFVPPCAVVNEQYEAVYLANMSGHFLTRQLGAPTTDILLMIRDELRGPLRAAIHKAVNDHQLVTLRGIKVVSEGKAGSVTLSVEPFTVAGATGRLVMVRFESTDYPVELVPAVGATEQIPDDDLSREAMIRHLEEQVQVGHDQLLATVEQLETSNESFVSANEELISMNEEFQSTNEELQSTNEELETSKEELQTLNEELVTVNAELRQKVEELDRANTDLENFLTSSGIATIFLGVDLIIKRYTSAVADIFNLIPSDLGRPFRHMAGRIDWPSFSEDARTVLARRTLVERELIDLEKGTCYLMRLLPYRSAEGEMVGLVLALIDITEKHRAEEEIEAGRTKLEGALASMSDAVFISDAEGKFIHFNEAFATFHKFRTKEECATSLDEYPKLLEVFMANGEPTPLEQWAVSRALRGETATSTEYTLLRKDTGEKWVGSYSFAPIRNQQGVIVGSVVSGRDITERKRVEAEALLRGQQIELAQSAAGAGMWDWVLDSGKIEWSRELFALYGLDPDRTAAGFDIWRRVVHPDDLEAASAAIDRVIKESIPLDNLYRVIRPADGQVRWISALGKIIADTDGRPARMMGICLDVTERRLAQEAVRVSEELYHSLFSNMLNGFAYCRMLFEEGKPTDFIYLNVNTAFERQTGLRDVVGRKVSEVIPGIQGVDPGLLEIYGRVALTGVSEQFEYCLESLQEWFWVSVYSPKPEYFVALFDVITERKQTEADLKTSNAHLHSLLTGMSEGAALHTLIRDDQGHPVDYLIVDLNPAFERILGVQRADVVGKSATEAYRTASPPYFAEFLAVAESGDPRRMEVYFSPLAQQFDISVTPWGDGGFATIFSDITERKKMEEVLLFLAQVASAPTEEDFFQRLARFLAGVLDMEFVCIDILEEGNLTAVPLAIYSDGAFEDNIAYTLKDTPCGEVVANKVCCYREGVRHQFREDAVLQEMGAESYVGTVLWSADGRPIGLIAVIGRHPLANPELAEKMLQVVGTRAAAELESRILGAALGEQERLLRLVIDMIPAGIAYVGTDLRYRVTNRKYEEWFGGATGRLQGRSPREVLGAAIWELATPYIDRVLAGETADFEYTLSTVDGGARWLHATLAPFIGPDDRPSGYVTHVTDITAEREATDELRRAKEEAESANETKSRFLANMSHELRTPMNGVLGMIQVAMFGELSDKQRRFLETALEAGNGLVRILNDILDLTQAESGKLTIVSERFDLGSTIFEVVKILVLEAERKGLDLTCAMDEEVPEQMCGDRLRLQQVLTNLIANAVKFTDHGTVAVVISLGVCVPGRQEIVFTVTDTGVGIPADKQLLLFQPFSQVDDSTTRRFGGAGLGLVICREIVERMGGTISCDSEEGKGSVFTVTLPFLTTPEQADSVIPSPKKEGAVPDTVVPGPEERRARILIAEDDPVNWTTLRVALEKNGCQPSLAVNGLKAVEMWEQEPYDLIVMDIGMPMMTGIEATRTIRQKERERGRGHIPILALTAHAFKEDLDACLAAGMDYYVAKPVDLDGFMKTIRKILGLPNPLIALISRIRP